VPTDTAAWLVKKKAALKVGPAPSPRPLDGETVVANHAVAINPIDRLIQRLGRLIVSWIRLPFVLGAPIPSSLSYQDAAVLPLALSTAACVLCRQDQLALRHPSAAPTPAGETLLAPGGSQALAEGRYRTAPAAHVIGEGLESVQLGLDAHKHGVPAQKIVVSL